MSDVFYLLLTLVSFAALAVLTGLLDRAVVSVDDRGRTRRER